MPLLVEIELTFRQLFFHLSTSSFYFPSIYLSSKHTSPEMSARNPESFRFLELPIEIRVMVYERLPRRIRHTHIREHPRSNTVFITLITRSMSVGILRTCRAVYREARNIVQKIMTEFILATPPKIILVSLLWGEGMFLAAIKCILQRYVILTFRNAPTVHNSQAMYWTYEKDRATY